MSGRTNTQSYTLDEIVKMYLDDYNGMVGDSQNELEVRFGTRGVQQITKIDFDNVIKKLKSLGFTSSNELGVDILKIQSEFIDINTGRTKVSNVRTEIVGGAIKKFCNTNSLGDLISDNERNVSFTLKTPAKHGANQVYPVNIDNFNFRVSYSNETNLTTNSPMVKGLLHEWGNNKKNFRLMKRVTFTHPSSPFKIDLSIVKSSNTNSRKQSIPVYKFKDSGVVSNNESYEIEIESANNAIIGSLYDKSKGGTSAKLVSNLKKIVKYVLGGLQGTNYPISYPEMDETKIDYYNLINNTKGVRKATNRDFCGPSSYTLELKNVQPVNDDSTIPNIRNNYTVTDKADGARKLLYINNKGKVYFLTTNMNVEFTGAFVSNNKIFNSLLDGEHILHDKMGKYINLYTAFDIYYINNVSVRDKGFVPLKEEDVKVNFRLPILINFIETLNKDIKSITSGDVSLTITQKTFYMAGDDGSIFGGCKTILNRIADGLFEYETDGLIFTPAENAVGSNNSKKAANPVKTTWDYSFKWKPPEFNSIDFLISFNKQPNGEDTIGNIFQSGQDMNLTEQLTQYKSLTLRCGFDQRKHGYINPCNDVIEDNLPKYNDIDDTDSYKPIAFYPTNPYDVDAHKCNIILRNDQTGNKQVMTEEHEIIYDNTIVEFKYDMSKPPGYRWIPMKVRYDKTAEFRQGIKNYGNAYHVANSNWHSIHHPVTSRMLMTGEGIPGLDNSDDTSYYKRDGVNIHTNSLRNFHNLLVKKTLITKVSSRGDTLIDLSVGKAGDFSKWILSKLSFVFGIDLSRDNIENKMDGACARFLDLRKQYHTMPFALFVNGNSALNIRDGEGIITDKGKQTTNAIFGVGTDDDKLIGKGVSRQFGKVRDGFNVCSCQFSLHYFFENRRTLEGFLRNVSECTKVGGYFIGGCYDGTKIFDYLRDSPKIIFKNGENIICEIDKGYENTTFPDNISSLGYTINVYQDSINQYIKEYLVNFPFFIRVMENYGFVPLSKEEINDMGLPKSYGSFRDLYNFAEQEIKKNRSFEKQIGKSMLMSPGEKKLSFLNNYFIFKKIRNVDTKKISLDIADESDFQVKLDQTDSLVSQAALTIKPKSKKVKKLGKKVKLTITDSN